MRRILLLLFVLTCMVLVNGCVVSRTGEKAWNVGVVDYYADFSSIQKQTVYEHDSAFYIAVEGVGYKPAPGWIGLAAPPASHMFEYKIRTGKRIPHRWMKISFETKEYLCNNAEDAKQYADIESRIHGELMENMTAPATDAVKHRIVKTMHPPGIMPYCCGDMMVNTQRLRREKSAGSYWLLPIVVVGYVWDIPATIAMSVFFDIIIVPGMLISGGGSKMAGGI